MTDLLKADSITVRFGGVTANDGVDVTIGDGELVGIIGPNGAGKTTFIDAITGFVPSEGRVQLDGEELSGLAAAARSRAGLVRTWQSVELFGDLSISDNLAVAAHQPRRFDLLRELVGRGAPRPLARIQSALDRVGLDGVGDLLPDELSHGSRKLVGVARALVSDPRVLCLDEPAAGLDEAESRELGAQLRELVDKGMTMLLVDHDMSLVLGVCDRIYVMDTGAVIASGTSDEIRTDPRVLEAYLGTGGAHTS
ncbi:MAG TPA: ABC transporter ATP-binding protein [Acidimicrobiales bacterium]